MSNLMVNISFDFEYWLFLEVSLHFTMLYVVRVS